jgi:hypothetical protein
LSWVSWAAAGVILLVMVIEVPRRFLKERQQLEAFDATDLDYFKVVTVDWKRERIKKRALRLGWEAFQEDDQDRNANVLVLKRSGEASASISDLLKHLHKASLLPCMPQRVDLNLDEIRD